MSFLQYIYEMTVDRIDKFEGWHHVFFFLMHHYFNQLYGGFDIQNSLAILFDFQFFCFTLILHKNSRGQHSPHMPIKRQHYSFPSNHLATSTWSRSSSSSSITEWEFCEFITKHNTVSWWWRNPRRSRNRVQGLLTFIVPACKDFNCLIRRRGLPATGKGPGTHRQCRSVHGKPG